MIQEDAHTLSRNPSIFSYSYKAQYFLNVQSPFSPENSLSQGLSSIFTPKEEIENQKGISFDWREYRERGGLLEGVVEE